jgi:hypothetical protein
MRSKSSTAHFKHLAKIITPETRIVLMTGTPASQSPGRHGLAVGLAPRTKQWIDRVMVQQTQCGAQGRRTGCHQAVLTPSIRFTKAGWTCPSGPTRIAKPG